MSAGAHPRTDVLRIRVRVCDLIVLRRACRIIGTKTVEGLAAEAVETYAAEFRRSTNIEPSREQWDATDLRVFRDTNVEVHRRRLTARDEQRALALVAQGEGDTAIAKKFGCWPGTINYLRKRAMKP